MEGFQVNKPELKNEKPAAHPHQFADVWGVCGCIPEPLQHCGIGWLRIRDPVSFVPGTEHTGGCWACLKHPQLLPEQWVVGFQTRMLHAQALHSPENPGHDVLVLLHPQDAARATTRASLAAFQKFPPCTAPVNNLL